MRKRGIIVLLAAVTALSGCSGYYRSSSESAGPAETSELVETAAVPGYDEETIAAAQGPGGGVPGSGDITVESLELDDAGNRAVNPEIMIASDIHYLAKELTDFGDAFERMAEQGDGKAVPYVWEIFDAFLDTVTERKPQALILSGDLSLQGEKLSHAAVAQKLARVERAGVQVVVIPGNHDLNNPAASGYQGENVIHADPTSPEEFAEIYADYGYSEAVSRDPGSLSYLYELADGTWLLMLDSCQYENGNQVGGMIRSETYEWMSGWLETAWLTGRNVIAVAHHNLLDESRIYEDDCTIEHSEELERMLDDWDVTLFLSGHLHVQHYRSSRSCDIDEIVTGSLAMAPCQYGVLKYFGPEKYDYHTEKVNVKAWADLHDNPDENLQNFDEYADDFLRTVFYNQAYASLQDKGKEEADVDAMADFYALLNAYSVAGRAVEIRQQALDSWEYLMWQEYSRTDIKSMYLDEILEDAVCDYNTFQRDEE